MNYLAVRPLVLFLMLAGISCAKARHYTIDSVTLTLREDGPLLVGDVSLVERGKIFDCQAFTLDVTNTEIDLRFTRVDAPISDPMRTVVLANPKRLPVYVKDDGSASRRVWP